MQSHKNIVKSYKNLTKVIKPDYLTKIVQESLRNLTKSYYKILH